MINYNDPIELTEIFRVATPDYKKKEEDPLAFEKEDEDFISTLTNVEMKVEEFSMKTAIVWEDIKSLKQYCYGDRDWKQLKGEKYYITLHNAANDILVLGSYKSMLEYWKQFRNEYPMFTNGMDKT